ncbi:ATP-binding cassette domain-containing protein [Oribacterium sp. FC2011]|uniref:ATP-binding cassette domain-containing protein n=1 Tax=Oribacterium sp. FC2011 TaxID=1408311 RepID=UPI0004E1DBE9|nr:ATP-binding cassette domain-containing protein [Oribacterium sp. FC2011]
MSWFGEQISQRIKSDQTAMDESLRHIASSILGKQTEQDDDETTPAEAMEEILKYYHKKPVEIPADITDPDEQLSYSTRSSGLMSREIQLYRNWYRDSMGPVLAFRKEDNTPAALIPGAFFGYSFYDPETGKRVKVNSDTSACFKDRALCFYNPLPNGRLGVTDLFFYLSDCLDLSDYMVLIFLSLCVTLLGLLMTNLTRALTGFIPESGNLSLLTGTAVFMFSVISASGLISMGRQLMMDRISIKTSFSLDAAMMMRVMNMPAGFFRNHTSGELVSRYNTVGQVFGLLFGNVFSLGISALFSLMYIAQIFRFTRALVLPAIILMLAGIIISIVTGLIQLRHSYRIMESAANENSISFSLISGVQKIRLSGAEKRAFAKWGHVYADTAKLVYNPPLAIRGGQAISAAVNLAGTITLFYIAVKSGVTPSEYIAFNAAYGALMAAITSFAGITLSVAGIRPILDMAAPILEGEPESAVNRKQVLKLRGDIELSNVSFRYLPDMPYVIHDLNLKITAGEYIGIVGTSGCGKSTLVRLLLGFEKPDRGAVYYDNRDLKNLDLSSVRRCIGTVIQDGSLIQGDIFTNISLASPGLSLEEAWKAAEIAGIADDIRSFPMGMQTQISEGHGGISGGQKQRLLIARAVASDPQVLIFDEATSALDNVTQKKVAEALDKLRCTRIVIAHRLSTILNCDRILVMDEGRFIEEGTYEELLKKNGVFAELISRQRLDT